MAPTRMAATLKDIARIVKTSEATVSLVLNGKQYHRVSPEMRKRVETVAAELGYQPNRQAQLLARGRSMTVAILVNSLLNGFFARYVALIESHLAQHGYHLSPAETLNNDERFLSFVAMIPKRMCDAVISLDHPFHLLDDPKYDLGAPIVVRSEDFNKTLKIPDEMSCASIDYAPATDAMFKAFEDQGARRLGLLMSSAHRLDRPEPSIRARYFRERTERSDAFQGEVNTTCVDEAAPFTEWYDAARRMLEADPAIDALYIHNAYFTPPVMKALRDCGRRPGADIAVAAYDDPEWAVWWGDGLAVVREPVEEVAAALSEMVLSRLNAKRSGRKPAPATSPTGHPGSLLASFEHRPSCRLR